MNKEEFFREVAELDMSIDDILNHTIAKISSPYMREYYDRFVSDLNDKGQSREEMQEEVLNSEQWIDWRD